MDSTDEDCELSAKRITLDATSISAIQDSITSALSLELQKLIDNKLSFIEEVRSEVNDINKSNATAFNKLTSDLAMTNAQYSQKFEELEQRFEELKTILTTTDHKKR